MKVFFVLISFAIVSAVVAVTDGVVTFSAVKAADGSLDVTLSPGYVINIPANVATLGVALLNQMTATVNGAQTRGTASMSVPMSSSGNLLYVPVNGVNYSLYIAEQLPGLFRVFEALTAMIDYFRASYML